MYAGGLCKHQLHDCSLQTVLAPSWCELHMNYSTLVPGWQAACLCSALGHGAEGPWMSAELFQHQETEMQQRCLFVVAKDSSELCGCMLPAVGTVSGTLVCLSIFPHNHTQINGSLGKEAYQKELRADERSQGESKMKFQSFSL